MSTLRNPVDQPTESPTRVQPRTEPRTPVFVDVTGRRQRWVRRTAVVVTIGLLGYLAVAGVLLVVRPGVSPLPLPGLSSHTRNAPPPSVRHQRAPAHHVRTVPTTVAPTAEPAPTSAQVQAQQTPRPSRAASTPPPSQTASEPRQQSNPTSHPTRTHTPPGLAKASGTPPGWSHGHSTGKSGSQQGQG